MAEYTRLQNTFASGYVDPTLHGLVNSEPYAAGLKHCTNFIPSSLGYLYRRPGTRYLGRSVASDAGCRVLAVKTYTGPMLIVMTQGAIDFYSISDGREMHISDGVVFDVTGRRHSIPWRKEDLHELNVYEMEGNLYIVHESYPPHVVYGPDAGDFKNFTYQTVKEASYTIAHSHPVVAIDDLMAGTFSCTRVEFEAQGLETFSEERHYPSCQTFKGGRWYLSGCTYAPSTIWASRSPDAKGNYRFNDFRVGPYYMVHVNATMTKTTVFKTNEGNYDVKRVSYSSEDTSTDADEKIMVDPTTVEVPGGTSTVHYYRYSDEAGAYLIEEGSGEGAGYAYVDLSIQGRTVRLDVVTKAETWSLKSDLQSDDAIELVESDMYGSRVNWLVTQQRVLAGTSRSIWMDSGAAATPAGFDMYRTLGTTTSRVMPVVWSSMVIYVPSDRKGVKAFSYDNDSGGYVMRDLSATARSLFRDTTIMEMALVEGQEPILWLLLANGRLLSCTLQSMGWAEHTLGGDGRVMSIYPYQDEEGIGSLYMAVERKGMVTMEQLEIEDLVTTDVYTLMDCSVEIPQHQEDTVVTVPASAPYHTGDGLQVVAGGWPRESFTMEDGTTQIGYGSHAGMYIGYPYPSNVTMLWQELPTNASQTSIGFRRKAVAMTLMVYRSAGAECGWYSGSSKHLEPFQRLAKTNTLEPTYADYYTGIVRLSVPSNTSEQVNATVECRQPLPMTIQALETRYIIQEA